MENHTLAPERVLQHHQLNQSEDSPESFLDQIEPQMLNLMVKMKREVEKHLKDLPWADLQEAEAWQIVEGMDQTRGVQFGMAENRRGGLLEGKLMEVQPIKDSDVHLLGF